LWSAFGITFLTAAGLDFCPPRSQSLPSPSLGGSEASESDSRVFRLGLCTTGRRGSSTVDTFSAKRTLLLLGFVLVSTLGDETSEGPAILSGASSLPRFLVTLGLIFVGAIASSRGVSFSSPSPRVLVIPALLFDAREMRAFPSRSLRRLLLGDYISAGCTAKLHRISSFIYRTRALITSWRSSSFIASNLACSSS